jgi:hypothetical protein
MNQKSISLVCLTVITLLAATLSTSLVSAYPDTIREKTFVTYVVTPTGTPGTDSYNAYGYSGIHWRTGTNNIAYSINLSGAPVGAATAVKAAFETWDNEVKVDLFSDNVETVAKMAGNKFDGKNIVSWGRLGRGIIAQTTVWYNTNTHEIVEFGMVFSTAYKWGMDGDGEGSKYTLTKAFDVQDIATHEAGHTLMLDDLYTLEAKQLTMYGYGDYGQTYAISLGAGDVSGIHAIYEP